MEPTRFKTDGLGFETARHLTLHLGNDECNDCPMDWDGQWTLHSFNNRHVNFTHPDTLMDEHGNIPIGLRRKLKAGTAF